MLTKLLQVVLFFYFSINCCLGKVENIVVFGDSYSDVGNKQLSSNGPLWSQDLAVGWNASLYSFAFSGATCDRTLYSSNTSASPSIIDQIEMYYKQQLVLSPEDTIYAFWVGYTDIYNMVQANKKEYNAIVDCITQQMRNVRKVFQSNRFIMFTLAPMENMPYFNNDEDKDTITQQYKKAVDEFNEQLHETVFNMVGHHKSLELDLVDAHDLLKDMINTPTEFGFKDGQHSFWDSCQGQCNDLVDDYIWWDKTHLTGGAHRVIANSILMSDSMEPSITLTPSSKEVDILIQTPGSKFQSPQYKPKYNTGLIDTLIKKLDAAKDITDDHKDNTTTTTTDYVDSTSDDDSWIRPLYFGALLTISLCIGFVFYNNRSKRRGGGNLAALSGLVRNRNNNGRGQFTPLRNLDTPPSEV